MTSIQKSVILLIVCLYSLGLIYFANRSADLGNNKKPPSTSPFGKGYKPLMENYFNDGIYEELNSGYPENLDKVL